MVKRGVFIVLMFFCFCSCYGDKVKYKDIVVLLDSGEYKKALPLLKEYIRDDPSNPSANFFLALIYEERYKNLDPIKDYLYAINNAIATKNRYVQSKILIDEKEIKKNGEKYYRGFVKKHHEGKDEVVYSDVASKIDSEYKYINQYTEIVPKVYENFVNSFYYYQKALSSFGFFKENFDSDEEIALQFNETTRSRLQDLSRYQDSTVYYFDAYKNELKTFPLDGYGQIISLFDFETLGGLELSYTSHYFVDTISLPNFRGWLTSIFELVERAEGAKKEAQLIIVEQIDFIKKSEKGAKTNLENEPKNSVSSTLAFLEPNSLAILISDYLEDKIDYLSQNSVIMPPKEGNQNFVSTSSISKTLMNLVAMSRMLKAIEEKSDQENYLKYREMVDENFKTLYGLKEYIEDEKEFVKSEQQAWRNILIESVNIGNLSLQTDTIFGYYIEPSIKSICMGPVGDTYFYGKETSKVDSGSFNHYLVMISSVSRDTFLVNLDSIFNVLTDQEDTIKKIAPKTINADKKGNVFCLVNSHTTSTSKDWIVAFDYGLKLDTTKTIKLPDEEKAYFGTYSSASGTFEVLSKIDSNLTYTKRLNEDSLIQRMPLDSKEAFDSLTYQKDILVHFDFSQGELVFSSINSESDHNGSFTLGTDPHHICNTTIFQINRDQKLLVVKEQDKSNHGYMRYAIFTNELSLIDNWEVGF